jgi:hypothetical protein
MTNQPRRPKLSELSRARPEGSEFDKVFRALETDSDRGAALIAAALLDNTLEDALAIVFEINLTDSEHHEIFVGQAPLAGLGAKIRICHALGIYGDITRNDLLVVAHIRNVFAHSPNVIDFTHETVAAACQNFQTPQAFREAGIFKRPKSYYEDVSPRNIFLRVCYEISVGLAFANGHTVLRKDRALRELTAPLNYEQMPEDEVRALVQKEDRERHRMP